MSQEDFLTELQERHPELQKRESIDLPAFNVAADQLTKVADSLRQVFKFDLLTDVTAVDWNDQSPRFTVFHHLYSTKHHAYLRLAVDCEDDENPEVPSLASFWPAADWHERETYDMFGIKFTDHPDMRRILMWDEYPYFPLRKDFPLAGHETEIPGLDQTEKPAEGDDVKMIPAPMMGGPFTAPHRKDMSKSEPRAKDQSWSEKQPKPKS
ncbi:MAG: NADH-quinone oxidoreductase subunit C [Opitutales bacterium]|nr:NADH-quinone oxidoreductase subunit C [Opitutales bacterium]MCH8541262.1 NADH-quinone oxidoreductase subunit C [Opitutales bacterium]